MPGTKIYKTWVEKDHNTGLWQIHCEECRNRGGNYKDKKQAEELATLHGESPHPAR